MKQKLTIPQINQEIQRHKKESLIGLLITATSTLGGCASLFGAAIFAPDYVNKHPGLFITPFLIGLASSIKGYYHFYRETELKKELYNRICQ